MDDSAGEIRLDVVNSIENYRRAYAWVLTHQKRSSPLNAVLTALFRVAFFLAMIAFAANAIPNGPFVALFLTVAIAHAAYSAWLYYNVLYRLPAKMKAAHDASGPARYVFTRAGLRCTTKHADSQLTWDAFTGFVLLPSVVLLPMQNQTFTIIPRNVLPPDDQETLERWLANSLAHRTYLRE